MSDPARFGDLATQSATRRLAKPPTPADEAPSDLRVSLAKSNRKRSRIGVRARPNLCDTRSQVHTSLATLLSFSRDSSGSREFPCSALNATLYL
jgi:hypothetical protein